MSNFYLQCDSINLFLNINDTLLKVGKDIEVSKNVDGNYSTHVWLNLVKNKIILTACCLYDDNEYIISMQQDIKFDELGEFNSIYCDFIEVFKNELKESINSLTNLFNKI